MHVTLVCADEDRWAIGMRSISAALVAAGHRTRLVFLHSPDACAHWRALESIVSLCAQSDLIGISSMSRGSRNAKAILGALRRLGKPLVWGGMHPTLCPEDCTSHADMICRGEGEDFMVELAERLAAGKDYRDIRNAAYVQNGQLVINEMRPLIADLDRLPTVDLSFVVEVTVDSKGEVRPGEDMRRSSNILVTGSRGCLYNCHYCSNSKLRTLYAGKGRLARKMSVGKFIETVIECQQAFPKARRFYFTDEDFFARTVEEFREFAEVYPRKVGIPFECMASPQQITKEKTELLVKAGMWRVDVGVESGSDRVKKEVYNRPVSNAVVMKAASVINQHPQLVAYYFFMIGNPYEKREDVLQTINLIMELPHPFFIRTYNLVFLPGTHLFEKARSDGIIRGLEDSGYDSDFLAGFDYRNSAWKMGNLYLNGLVSLMTGKSKRRRVGFVPRFLLPVLLHPRWIDFNDRHPVLSKAIITAARHGLRLRRGIYAVVSRVLRNPGSVHNAAGLLRIGKAPRETSISSRHATVESLAKHDSDDHERAG